MAVHSAFGVDVPEALEDVVVPERLALLVYDMQAGIAGRLPGGAELIATVNRVLAATRERGCPVFFSRHRTLPVSVAGAAQLKGMMALQRASDPSQVTSNFAPGAPGFSVVEDLAPTEDEVVFDKLGMSAFMGSLLEFALRDKGLTAFAIVGAVLELGIEPTVRHGADLGFTPVLVQDACFSLSDQARQASVAALERVAMVIDVDGFTSALSTATSSREVTGAR